MKSVFVGIKNVLLWSYARGTWQYDLLCALIVLTLLFWPKGKAAPTAIAKTTTAVVVADGMWQRDIEWQTLQGFLQQKNRLDLLNSPREAVVLFLQSETDTVITLSSVAPFGDAQGHVGYRARYRTN